MRERMSPEDPTPGDRSVSGERPRRYRRPAVLLGVGVILFVGLAGCCVAAYLVLGQQPEERHLLHEVPCGDLPLRLVHVNTVTNWFEGIEKNELVLEVGEGEGQRVVAVDALGTPHHLPVDRRPPSSWHGEGSTHLHLFLDPAAISAEDATRVEACVESDIEPTLRAIAPLPFVLPPIEGKGRVYWRAPATALELRFADGNRSLAVTRGGAIAYDVTTPVSSTGSLVGRVIMRGDEVVVRCCDPMRAPLTATEIPRFRDAAGRDLEEYFGVSVEPEPDVLAPLEADFVQD
jgi:hypothetical protein